MIGSVSFVSFLVCLFVSKTAEPIRLTSMKVYGQSDIKITSRKFYDRFFGNQPLKKEKVFETIKFKVVTMHERIEIALVA